MLSFPIGLRPVVLLLGDSLTQQGFGMNGGVGWASSLANCYSRRADVLNRGFSGYNSRFLRRILEQSILLCDYENVLFCTIFLGANDAALPGERQHVPLDEYQANLDAIVTDLRSKIRSDLPVVLLTPPPVDTTVWDRYNKKLERDPSYRHNDVAKQYGDVVKQVASQHEGCLVVDVFELLGATNPQEYAPHLSDGLHLSSSGNELVYEGLMQVLESTEMAPKRLPMDQYTRTISMQTTRPCIVVLGDSFTEYGFDHCGWASRLASDYSRRADILNRGFEGYTTRDFLTCLPEMLSENVSDGALFITLWLGGNDAIDDEKHVPLDEFETNLEAIVKKLRERIAPPTTPQGECLERHPIILVTPPPVNDAVASDYLTSEATRRYADRVQLVADKTDCSCLNLFQVFGNKHGCWTADGMHLNAKGNILVYEGMRKQLEKDYPQLIPMTDGNGKYGDIGIPLEGKLWSELC